MTLVISKSSLVGLSVSLSPVESDSQWTCTLSMPYIFLSFWGYSVVMQSPGEPDFTSSVNNLKAMSDFSSYIR